MRYSPSATSRRGQWRDRTRNFTELRRALALTTAHLTLDAQRGSFVYVKPNVVIYVGNITNDTPACLPLNGVIRGNKYPPNAHRKEKEDIGNTRLYYFDNTHIVVVTVATIISRRAKPGETQQSVMIIRPELGH